MQCIRLTVHGNQCTLIRRNYAICTSAESHYIVALLLTTHPRVDPISFETLISVRRLIFPKLIFSAVELLDDHFLLSQVLQVVLVHYLALEQAVKLGCSSSVQGPADTLEGTSVLNHHLTHLNFQEVHLQWVLNTFCSFSVSCYHSQPNHLRVVTFVQFQPIEMHNWFHPRAIYISYSAHRIIKWPWQ